LRVLLARASLGHDYGAVGAALFDIVNVQNWTRRHTLARSSTLASVPEAAPRPFSQFSRVGLAHQEVHLPCRREAGGSSPPASTSRNPKPQSSSGRAPLWYGGERRSIRPCDTNSITHSWRNGRRSRLRSGRLTAWRFKYSRVHQLSLASPSGKGIGPTHRHSQVRVLERAPTASLL
jgi:hypothetical protein